MLLAMPAVGNKEMNMHQLLLVVCCSVYVAQFPEYTVPLIDHLLEFKIGHWDMCVQYFTCCY